MNRNGDDKAIPFAQNVTLARYTYSQETAFSTIQMKTGDVSLKRL